MANVIESEDSSREAGRSGCGDSGWFTRHEVEGAVSISEGHQLGMYAVPSGEFVSLTTINFTSVCAGKGHDMVSGKERCFAGQDQKY